MGFEVYFIFKRKGLACWLQPNPFKTVFPALKTQHKWESFLFSVGAVTVGCAGSSSNRAGAVLLLALPCAESRAGVNFLVALFSFARWTCILLWKGFMNLIMVDVEKKGLQACCDVLKG